MSRGPLSSRSRSSAVRIYCLVLLSSLVALSQLQPVPRLRDRRHLNVSTWYNERRETPRVAERLKLILEKSQNKIDPP
jgi:hypothetical protein